MWMMLNKALTAACVLLAARQPAATPVNVNLFDCKFSNHCPFYDYFLWRIKSYKIKVMPAINWQQNPWQPTHTHTTHTKMQLSFFHIPPDFIALADQSETVQMILAVTQNQQHTLTLISIS